MSETPSVDTSIPPAPKKFSITRLKTDRKKEDGGVWIEAGEGLRLKIARIGNKNYEKFILEQQGPFARRVGRSSMEEMQDRIRDAIAHTVLLGWENLVDEHGVEISFSPSKALELFISTPEFYRIVSEYASDIEMFREGSKAEAAKN